MLMKKNLTREERLRKRTEIINAFSFSRQVSCNGLKLLFIENKLNRNRILAVTKKGYKRAVKRNRQKRIIVISRRVIGGSREKSFSVNLASASETSGIPI